MEIMQAATTLGNLIKESEVYKKLNAAKEEFEKCSEVSSYMTEYEAQQKALELLAAQKEPDTVVIDEIQNRLNHLFEVITTHSAYMALYEAQEKFDQFMAEVNNQITYTITGKLPCTHDCSSCHADCSHNH